MEPGRGPGRTLSRVGAPRLHRSLQRFGLGLGRRRHRPHAPQLPRRRFLRAPTGPAPGLECCASAARHMETGATRPNRSLGSRPGPAPAPPSPHLVTNSAPLPPRAGSPAPPRCAARRAGASAFRPHPAREEGLALRPGWERVLPGEWRFSGGGESCGVFSQGCWSRCSAHRAPYPSQKRDHAWEIRLPLSHRSTA